MPVKHMSMKHTHKNWITAKQTSILATHPGSGHLTNSRQRKWRPPLVSYIPHMNESVYWTASQQIWVKLVPVKITNYSSVRAKCLCLNQISARLPWQYLHSLIALKWEYKTYWKCSQEMKINTFFRFSSTHRNGTEILIDWTGVPLGSANFIFTMTRNFVKGVWRVIKILDC